MAKKIILDKTVKFFVVVIGLVFIAFILKELQNIFIPFVIAYFLFFLFNPLNNFLEKKKIPQFISIIADVIIIAFFAWGISYFVIDTFSRFGAQLPVYADKLNKIVISTAASLGIQDQFFKNFSIQNLAAEIDYKLLAGSVFNSTFSFLQNIFFILLFFIFVVTGHTTIYEAIRKRYVYKKVKPELKEIKKKYGSVPEAASEIDQWMGNKYNIEKHEKEERLSNTFREINDQIKKYIIAKIAINLSAGIIVALLLAAFGVDFPVIWGIFTFLLNFIPSIGSAIALILPAVIVLIQSGSVGYALLIALVMAGIQTLFFNVAEPAVIGKRLNLNPMLILLSVLVWGYIWGVAGMLLSVPLTAIIKIIISNSESKNLKFISDLMGSPRT